MNTIYHWVGFAVVWGVVVGGGCWLAYYLVMVPIALFQLAVRKYDWLNYRYYFTLKLFRYFVLQQDFLREGSPQQFAGWLRAWNDRSNTRSMKIRRQAHFYRAFYAYIIRQRRHAWAASWE